MLHCAEYLWIVIQLTHLPFIPTQHPIGMANSKFKFKLINLLMNWFMNSESKCVKSGSFHHQQLSCSSSELGQERGSQIYEEPRNVCHHYEGRWRKPQCFIVVIPCIIRANPFFLWSAHESPVWVYMRLSCGTIDSFLHTQLLLYCFIIYA